MDKGTDRLHFVQTMADRFSKEFLFNSDDYKRINKAFEIMKKEMLSIKLSVAYERAFCKLINDCEQGTERTNMLADIFHMHINRVFYSDQRVHESVLYQYLLKQTKMRVHIATIEREPLLIP